jgi:hypothetical protein
MSCHNKVEANPERSRFIPTLYRAPMSGDPLPETLVAAGAKVSHEQEALLWTLANRQARFAR